MNMQKAILGLGAVVISASLMTACNTVKGTANGLEQTAAGVGHTVTGTVFGAERDVKATEKAVTTHHKAAHKAHKKAQHKAHKRVHHKVVKKAAVKPVESSEESVPAAE